MACTDFGITSYCSVVSNIGVTHFLQGIGSAQNFLNWQEAGYNMIGCQWFTNKINTWTSQMPTTGQAMNRLRKQSKIDWARCMLDTCCGGAAPPVVYGCMDDGNKGNDYLNNQGTIASPQFGSVTPGTPALNWYPGATSDNGSCYYGPVTIGCKDPAAFNYDASATHDCGGNVVSPYNVNYTNFQGTQPPGSWTPYGDVICCHYAPTAGESYNYRDLWVNSMRPFNLGSLGYVDGAAGSGMSVQTVLPPGFPNVPFPDPLHGTPSPPAAALPYRHSSKLDGVIGMPKFKFNLSQKDVNGHYYTIQDLTVSKEGWTISIWDLNKQFLGRWHYQNLHSWHQVDALQDQRLAHPAVIPGVPLNTAVSLELEGVPHLDGPDPIVCYGHTDQYLNSNGDTYTGSNSVGHFNRQFANWGGAQRSVEPEYHRGHGHPCALIGSQFTNSVTFAYIKVEFDASKASNSFNDIHTGNNTMIDNMNVICAPHMVPVVNSWQSYGFPEMSYPWGNNPLNQGQQPSLVPTLSIIGTRVPNCSAGWAGVQPGLNLPVPIGYNLTPVEYSMRIQNGNHQLFPWPAAHQNVPPGCTWFPDLSTALKDGGCTVSGIGSSS